MRGTTCSGKDRFCDARFPKHTILSSDKIRLELTNDMSDQSKNSIVFDELRRRLELRLRLGAPYTVVNATNLKFKDVVQYVELAEKYGTNVVVLSIDPPSIEELKRRRDERVSEGGLSVPDAVIERHHNAYTAGMSRFESNEYDNFKFIRVEQTYVSDNTGDFSTYKYSPNELILNQNLDGNVIDYCENTDYYVIGDVHGCSDEYFELCEQVKAESLSNGRKSKIIQLGDIIDRGPSFARVILNDPADYRIMGNHELNFLGEVYGRVQCRSKARQISHEAFSYLTCIDQQSIIDKIKTRKQFMVMRMGNDLIMFTHAPLKEVETRGINDGILHRTTHSSFCMRPSALDLDSLQSVVAENDVTMYYGHQSWSYTDINEQVKSQLSANVKGYNLDSGCVYGKSLVAVRVNDERVFEVKANEVYFNE